MLMKETLVEGFMQMRQKNFFFVPPGHLATLFPVRALYPEPRTRLYEIRIYHHRSFALSVELPVGSGLQDPQQLWVRPA